jgi:two-component sensor histidine kinase
VQTLHGVADKEVVDAFTGRILALSKAHGLLGRENWEGVSLRNVIDQILEPFGLQDRRVARFTVEGDDVRLPPKAALTFAMVFHELATNAAKHGALSDDAAGRIDIAWQVEPTPQGDRMRLRWQESGGPPVPPPGRKGFGSRLIESGLAQELDGATDRPGFRLLQREIGRRDVDLAFRIGNVSDLRIGGFFRL